MKKNTAIVGKSQMFWEAFQITKMGINTADDLHLEIIIKNKWKNIVSNYRAIFCIKEVGLFDQVTEDHLRDIRLIKRSVHEYKSVRKTKFFFDIDKTDLVWMFQNLDYIETPGIGICLIPEDKFEEIEKSVSEKEIEDSKKDEVGSNEHSIDAMKYAMQGVFDSPRVDPESEKTTEASSSEDDAVDLTQHERNMQFVDGLIADDQICSDTKEETTSKDVTSEEIKVVMPIIETPKIASKIDEIMNDISSNDNQISGKVYNNFQDDMPF